MSLVLVGWVGQFDNGGPTNANLSADLNEFAGLNSFHSIDSMPNAYGASMRSVRPPTSDVLVGILGRSYFDDLYNRVFIEPSFINAGNLVSSQSREVVVWNAYLSPVDFTAAGFTNGSGLSLALPVGVTIPHVIPPLGELTMDVVLDVGGPPTINASLDLTIDGEDYSIPITGRRVVLFPFPPNWASPFDETFVFRSWVIRSEDGTEQTGSESGNHPRRMFEFNIVLKNEAQLTTFENLMFAWQARFFALPHWAEQAYLDAPVASGETEIEFDTAGMTLNAGGLLALYKDETTYEVREIASVVGDLVTVTTGFDLPWPVNSKVMPCFVSLANEDMSGAYDTTRVARVPMSFECEPSQTAGNTATGAAPLTYRGFELYLGRINWNSSVQFGFKSDRMKIDMKTGKVSVTSASGYSVYSRQHTWTLFDAADAADLRQFLGRRQGVAIPVYMPSGKPDFVLNTSAAADETFINVEDNGYVDLIGAHPARRDILIQLENGTYLARRITSAVSIVGGARLNLDAAHGVAFTPADILRISYLTLFRFESPSTTIRWLTNSKGTVRSTLVSTQTGT